MKRVDPLTEVALRIVVVVYVLSAQAVLTDTTRVSKVHALNHDAYSFTRWGDDSRIHGRGEFNFFHVLSIFVTVVRNTHSSEGCFLSHM